MTVYSYPQMSRVDLGIVRLLGPGLGNLLFPWARSIVASYMHGMIPIFPTWPQIKLGPLLRRERDLRTYMCVFKRPRGSIGGWRKMHLLSTAKRVREDVLDSARALHGDVVVVFRGMEGLFERIREQHRLVWTSLLSMVRDRHKGGLAFDFSRSISVHVRLGDFAEPTSVSELIDGNWGRRISMAWYVETVRTLRQTLGARLPVYVFSDGSDEELLPLLQEDNVRRLYFGSSIADLLALARANILVASGSTFSMWASYLGRMPVVWPEGQLRQRLYGNGAEWAEAEHAPGAPLQKSFVDELRK